MKEISLEELLEAGCHFGHQVTRSNPKARDFVFEARDNIQIIDLAKTKEGLDEAAAFVKSLGQAGGRLLVVATKKQARQIVEDEVLRVRGELLGTTEKIGENLFYITLRWIGGILTNFEEVSKNFQKLEDLKKKLVSDEEKAKYTKKEIGLWDKERQRLESFYRGIFSMKQAPDALFIVDSHLEDLAVKEALSTGVETVAIVDTNADPYIIDHPIPANDDAVGSIKLIVSHILDSFVEGAKSYKPPKTEEPASTSNVAGANAATAKDSREKEETKDKPRVQKTEKKVSKTKKKETTKK